LALNKQFTNRWNKQLKGTKSISEAKLEYIPDKKLFTFQIIGADKATVLSIEERSKGALWYFTFLLKTEFRKKKLRAELGKTLYLIDEPGSNLHSTAQTNMVVDFRTLASDSNVIYTTHSQYLIDKENLQNVYIVSFSRNTVHVDKFQSYLQGKKIKTSYYQPIIDALEIQPFSLDISWDKVLLVEGIYDYCGFKLIFDHVLKKTTNYVIVPGTSASNLLTLLSLHVGWGAQIVVLLDDDDEGKIQKEKYIKHFPILTNRIRTLDFVNEESKKQFEFESLFAEDERRKLVKLCNMGEEVTKNQFQQSLAACLNDVNLARKVKAILSKETIQRFEKIYKEIDKGLSVEKE
jgi:predicted ATP-dependent endonuclease of OLD family